jgi:vacuolar-type H+-ATPase subunit F/Vma7
MEEIKGGSIKNVTGNEIASETLKVVLPGIEFPEKLFKARQEFLSGKEKPFRVARWVSWPKAIGESEVLTGLNLAGELSEVKRHVDDLDSQVKSLVSELEQCKKGISTILNELKERPVIKQTELFEMDETLEVIIPIPVVIKEYSNEVIAAFPEIGAFGAGLCEAAAIMDLKKEIRRIFFELEGVSDNKLGKLPLTWKRVLLKVVRRIGNSQ